jgi:hypothetical protein
VCVCARACMCVWTMTVEGCCVLDMKERFRYFSPLNLAPNDPVWVQDAMKVHVFNNPRKTKLDKPGTW